ncbi:MAG: uracil phosphoribosyltransferase [Burkholderiales bacterium]
MPGAWVTWACTAIPRRWSQSSITSMPGGMSERDAVVLDPMLATGNSAVAAVERLEGGASPLDPLRVPRLVP